MGLHTWSWQRGGSRGPTVKSGKGRDSIWKCVEKTGRGAQSRERSIAGQHGVEKSRKTTWPSCIFQNERHRWAISLDQRPVEAIKYAWQGRYGWAEHVDTTCSGSLFFHSSKVHVFTLWSEWSSFRFSVYPCWMSLVSALLVVVAGKINVNKKRWDSKLQRSDQYPEFYANTQLPVLSSLLFLDRLLIWKWINALATQG